jgi:outer membrane protein OmpA-like peptidoglycan-associated protein
MFGIRSTRRRGNRDEAEKPFWISFSDLMTALMVLFLVVMGVALLAVTKGVNEFEQDEKSRKSDIEIVMNDLGVVAEKHPGIKIDKDRHVIDFGSRAQFAFGDWHLSVQQEEVLRRFVPEVLAIANSEHGKRILKRIVVEGYTDKTGTYLANMNLSLFRSQAVLCAMFATSGPSVLSNDQKEQVRQLFSVGGYSLNAAKDTAEESRRVEMRLEFLVKGEKRPAPPPGTINFGDCALR